MEYKFEICIGDWSGDGHGQNESFLFGSNKPIEEVREAYFLAKKDFKNLCPENFAYSDFLSDEEIKIIISTGFILEEEDSCSPEEMARYVAWFCMKGNQELELNYLPGDSFPTLHFYSYDSKKRHIGFIGYKKFYK